MKGEIFNLFESFVTQGFGADSYERLYSDSQDKLETKEPFVGPGTYPDSDFLILLDKAVAMTAIPVETAVRAFGKFALPHLIGKVPQFAPPGISAKQFLMSVNDVIHVEVRKIYRDTVLPQFDYIDTAPDKLTMIYSSPRRLYALVEGLIEGTAEYFSTPITYERKLEANSSIGRCRFELKFSK